HVDGAVLWLNMVLLFWLSLIPFATAYLGQSFALLKTAPLGPRHAVALYGFISLAAGVAYYFLHAAVAKQGRDDPKLDALHQRMMRKNRLALALYAVAVPVAYLN